MHYMRDYMTVKLKNKQEDDEESLERNKRGTYFAKLEIVFIFLSRARVRCHIDRTSTRPFNLISRTKETSRIRFLRLHLALALSFQGGLIESSSSAPL